MQNSSRLYFNKTFLVNIYKLFSINGYVRMIDLLISHGADIDARDYENGWTALMQATYYGFFIQFYLTQRNK